MPAASVESLLAQNLSEALTRSPQHLVELKLCQLHGLPNRHTWLFAQVETLKDLTIPCHRQLRQQIAHTFGKQVVVQRFLEREGVVLEARKQLAVAFVPAGKLSTPVRRR